MANIVQESFSINLRVLQVFWLYTPKNFSLLHTMRSYIFTFLIALHVPVLGVLYFLLEENRDVKRRADDAFATAAMWFYLPKLVFFAGRANRIKECLHCLEKLEIFVTRTTHKAIIDTHTKICKRNSKIFVISMILAVIEWTINPLLVQQYIFPVDIWLPINPAENLMIYYAVYPLVSLGVMYPTVSTAAMDTLSAGLVCLAGGHFKVLKDNLQHLYDYTNEEIENKKITNQPEQHHILYKKIQKCVKHHTAILNFIKKYEECFSAIVFSQFLGSILILCFLCWQLSILEFFSPEFFQTFCYFVICSVQIYFNCYYGTVLSEESNSLTNAVYMGKWYTFDIKSRKALITLMERSKKPSIVTVGKLLDLSLETFTTILRRSYSLLAVLKNQE